MKCSKLALAFLILLCTQIVACKKEDPNPELLDPIYSDLAKRAADSLKAYEENKAKLKTLREGLEKIEPNSIDLKDAEKEILKTQNIVVRAEQESRYFRIRAERRKFVDRIEYKKAFAADKPWPDHNEYSDYLVNIRLREISLNWGTRVPKLHDRKPAAAKKPEAPAKSGH